MYKYLEISPCQLINLLKKVIVKLLRKHPFKSNYCFNFISSNFNNFFSLLLSDLSTFEMVYKSTGTEMDCSNIIYCTNLCNILVD